MRIFTKNSYSVVLTEIEVLTELPDLVDTMSHFYSEKHGGYVFSALLNITHPLLTPEQHKKIMEVIKIDETREITDEIFPAV